METKTHFEFKPWMAILLGLPIAFLFGWSVIGGIIGVSAALIR